MCDLGKDKLDVYVYVTVKDKISLENGGSA